MAVFKSATLSEVSFKECKLLGIDWTLALWPRFALNKTIIFEECVLTHNSFFGLSLPQLSIKNCRCHYVDFTQGDFQQSDFSQSDFLGSTFAGTNLTKADFGDAKNYDININNNTIKQAKFSKLGALNLLKSLDITLVD
jgi:uncharacterized protein YjbI with pentapeptide repeats